MIGPELEQLLRRTNPWLWEPDTWPQAWAAKLPVPCLARAPIAWTGRLREDRVTLVIGPRRAGKTTLCWTAVERRGPELLHVNCEEPLFRTWCRSPSLFLADVAELLPRPRAFLFDELQHLEEAGLFLKGLADARPGCPILATGSSSFHLLARTRESLAGRAVRVRLLPFGLGEVSADLDRRPPLIRRSELRARVERMLRFGGYPDVWMGDTPERELSELVESVVVRDASDLFRIDAPDAFRKLLGLMAGQVGNLVNKAEWASICGFSARSVERYASLLEETHVVRLLRPWVSGKRAELTRAPKAFFVDNGVRNAVLGRFLPLDRRADVGQLLENWTYTELAKAAHPLRDTIGFWRTRSGAEVDFVWEHDDQLVAVEVKFGGAPRPRLTRSAHSFLEAVQPTRFFVVGNGPPHETTAHGRPVRWLEPAALPGALRNLTAP